MDILNELLEANLIVSFLTAYLFIILTKQNDVTILFKSEKQRTKKEKYKIKYGLIRSIVLDFILFIPISVILFRLVVFPLIFEKLTGTLPNMPIWFWYGAMGVCAFGFPFVTVKRIITRLALEALKEFTVILKEK